MSYQSEYTNGGLGDPQYQGARPDGQIALTQTLFIQNYSANKVIAIDKEIKGGLHRVKYKSLLLRDDLYDGIFSSRRAVGMLAFVEFEDNESVCNKYYSLLTMPGTDPSHWEEIGSSVVSTNNPLVVANLSARDALTPEANDFVNVTDARTGAEISANIEIYSASFIYSGSAWLRIYPYQRDANSHAKNYDTQLVKSDNGVLTADQIAAHMSDPTHHKLFNDANSDGSVNETWTSAKIKYELDQKTQGVTSGDGTKFLGDDGNYHTIDDSSEINDSVSSGTSVWSSEKTFDELEAIATDLRGMLDDTVITTTNTLSSSKIYSLIAGKFRVALADGTVLFKPTLQEAIDASTVGSSITMFANAGSPQANGGTSTMITHKNGVNIDTNGYNIPRLQDSTTSGTFSITGGGKVGHFTLTQPTTDITVDCYFDYTAATTSNGDGNIDSSINCKRFYLDKEVRVTSNTWLTIGGATDITFNKGMLVISEAYSSQDASMIIITSTFTGSFVIRGTYKTKSYYSMINIPSGCAGKIILENANIMNQGYPTDSDYNGNGQHGVFSFAAGSTTSLYLKGLCVIKGAGKSVFTCNRALTVTIDGELTYEGTFTGSFTPSFNRLTTHRVGEVTGTPGGGGAGIDDVAVSLTTTWSSSKISTEMANKVSINNVVPSNVTTYSSNYIEELIGDADIARLSATNVFTGNNTFKNSLRCNLTPGAWLISSWNSAGTGNAKFILMGDGYMAFGDGTNMYDTTLYRSAAGQLKTDDKFNAVGGLQENGVDLSAKYAAIGSTGGGSGTIRKDFEFPSVGVDVMDKLSFNYNILISAASSSANITSVTYQVSLDNSTWITKANIAAINDWIDDQTNGTRYYIKCVQTPVAGNSAEGWNTLTFTEL